MEMLVSLDTEKAPIIIQTNISVVIIITLIRFPHLFRHRKDHAYGSVLLPCEEQSQKESPLQRLHVGHPQKLVASSHSSALTAQCFLAWLCRSFPTPCAPAILYLSLCLSWRRPANCLPLCTQVKLLIYSALSVGLGCRRRCALRCAWRLCAALKGSIGGNKACQNGG